MGWSREECCRYNAFVSGCATSIASLALMHPQAAERICKSALYRALATYDAVYCESAPLIVAAAPGRVNIIGEHTDYSQGLVLPCALEAQTVVVGRLSVAKHPPSNPIDVTCLLGTVAEATKNEVAAASAALVADVQHRAAQQKCSGRASYTVASSAVPAGQHIVDFSRDDLAPSGGASLPPWSKYVRGVVACFEREMGIQVPSFQAAMATTVPIGAGLSSSAALEISLTAFLTELCRQHGDIAEATSPEDAATEAERVRRWARLCVAAEHEYAGVPCGSMDQTVSAGAHLGHALMIDCQDFSTRLVPLSAGDVAFMVCDSGVQHSLSGSEYPLRVAQCKAAVAIINKVCRRATVAISLRDVSMGELDQAKEANELSDLLYRRARHVVSENQRVVAAIAAMEQGRFVDLGVAMTASHVSLRDDFEVSCSEVDHLVDVTAACPGVLGSRITGGGFGGCTVSLIRRSDFAAIEATVRAKYPGLRLCFVLSPGQGAVCFNVNARR